MGQLKRQTSHYSLATVTVVGRSESSDLPLESTLSSSAHAALRWSNGHWRLVDLASRNGTWVSERPLDPGQHVVLNAGDTVSFGCAEETWTLVDDSPPRPFARTGQQEVRAEAELLALPDAGEPGPCIYANDPHGWMVDTGDDIRPILDREVLDYGGQRWRLYLPARPLWATVDAIPIRSLSELRLRLRCSLHEEYICADFLGPEGSLVVALGARAHHAVLLALARNRIENGAQKLDPSEHGWVHRSELARQLALSESHVNIMIHRLRQQAAQAGLLNAVGIVERRSGTGELRLGLDDVEIVLP